MNENKKIAAIYTRVSTSDQVREGHSLEEQKRRLIKLCEANDYEIYDVYTDAGISGKSTENRPQYQKMMADMRKGKFNLILAFKMDRISRDILDFEMFFREIKKYKCDIELLNDKIDTHSANGMMIARVLGAFCQFEREVIRERTLVGVESAVNKGHFGGKPPLGYMKMGNKDSKEKVWSINDEESEMVREIFELCLRGKTCFQISNHMREKYPNVVACSRTDKVTNEKRIIYRTWTDASISVILNNKSYMGVYEHRKRVKDKNIIEIHGKVPQIISEEIFNECQENLRRNGRNYYREKNYLFMQKLRCPKCGKVLACNGTRKTNGKDYLYYKCHNCNIYVREEWIEEKLISELNELLELYYILGDNYFTIDSDMAEAFNKCRLNHKIRFIIDEGIIKDHKQCNGYDELNELWEMLSYEAKCKFIYEFIDSIEIKRIKDKQTGKYNAEITDLKVKPSEMKKLFELKDNKLFDEKFGDGKYKFSSTAFKKEADALEYIDLLKKKYNIAALEFKVNREEIYDSSSMFKIINIVPTRAVEKRKTICLYLLD